MDEKFIDYNEHNLGVFKSTSFALKGLKMDQLLTVLLKDFDTLNLEFVHCLDQEML